MTTLAVATPALAKAPRPPARGFALAVPSLLLLLIFFVVPVVWLLVRSFTDPAPGLGNYAALIASPAFQRILANTFIVAALVTAVSLVLGFPLAWLLVVLPRGWSALVFGIVLLSMWTNLLARTYAWMVLLQSSGLINRMLIGLGVISAPLPLVNNLAGVTIGMTYIMLPFIVLPLHATISAIDPAILRAATLCGANRWQVFRHVFLPSCLPGIAAGCLMVFVMSLGYFVTPSLLGGSANVMLAEYIAQLVQSMLDWGTGSAAAFLLLAITLVLYWLQLRLVDPLASARLD
jgi:putative spermidine/putrescine transport system permease protein